jgi:transcriptional regulator with XRE-family HTH domain
MGIRPTRKTAEVSLFCKAFGNRLAHFRKERRISQGALGIKLGYSDGVVSNWEAGKSTPAVYELPAIASLLRVTMAELMGEEPTTKTVHANDAAPMPLSKHDRKLLRDEVQGTLWNTINEMVDIVTDTAITTLQAQGVIAPTADQKEAKA